MIRITSKLVNNICGRCVERKGLVGSKMWMNFRHDFKKFEKNSSSPTCSRFFSVTTTIVNAGGNDNDISSDNSDNNSDNSGDDLHPHWR